MPDVSVIIAAWNAERTIARAIRSACGQQGIDLEVIVADDASTDATAAAVRAIGDPRVHWVARPANGGPGAARNTAIAAARGAWIAVLDADDALLPGRLAGLVGTAIRNGLDIVTDNLWIEDAAGAPRLFIPEQLDGGLEHVTTGDYVRRNRLFGRRLGDGYLKPVFAAGFLRRHGLGYDPAVRIGEDFLIVAEAMALGAAYARVRAAGYVYAVSSFSLSHRLGLPQVQAMIDADRRIIERHRARLTPDARAAWTAHLRSLRDGACFVAMVDAIKAQDLPAFARHAARRPLAIRHFAMPVAARLARARQKLKAAPRQPVPS
jgi:succinoglycan biosynthesis protein ExoO